MTHLSISANRDQISSPPPKVKYRYIYRYQYITYINAFPTQTAPVHIINALIMCICNIYVIIDSAGPRKDRLTCSGPSRATLVVSLCGEDPECIYLYSDASSYSSDRQLAMHSKTLAHNNSPSLVKWHIKAHKLI